MKRARAIVATLAAAALGLSLLGGCSAQEEATEDEAAAQQEEETTLIIGDESEDSLTMVFINDTDRDITGFALAQSSDEESAYSENMLSDVWEAGQAATVYADPLDDQTTSSEEDGVALRPAYDIQLTFEDGATAVLHGVTFEEADEVTVAYDEDSALAYLTYDQNGSEASTLETEQAVKQQEEEAAAQAEAQAQAEAATSAEQQSTTDSSATGSSSGTSGYTYDYSYSSDTGSSDSGSSASESGGDSSGSGAGQSEDVCIDDLVLR